MLENQIKSAMKDDKENALLVKIADQLLVAQKEIDEFVLQVSLGKAEAREEFEKIKNEFRIKLREFRQLLDDFPHKVITPEVKQKIEELELQLALGKAETKDEFEKQKGNLTKAILSIENTIKVWMKDAEHSSTFDHEIEKFKLKLEILRLKFNLKKFEVKDDFREQMATTKREIEKIAELAKSKLKEGKMKYKDFTAEISNGYDQLKKAVKRL